MLIGLIGLLIVLALIGGMAAFSKARNKAALDWPTVEGEIVHSEATSKWSTDSQGHAVMRYKADIHFRYTVDGKTYDGKRITFLSAIIDTAAKAQALCDRYPLGARPPVYYNPKKPEDSVLERREAK